MKSDKDSRTTPLLLLEFLALATLVLSLTATTLADEQRACLQKR